MVQPTASSVTDTTATLTGPYSITINCNTHPDSTADQCVVMAMSDGRMTRTGNVNNYIHTTTYVYVFSNLMELLRYNRVVFRQRSPSL